MYLYADTGDTGECFYEFQTLTSPSLSWALQLHEDSGSSSPKAVKASSTKASGMGGASLVAISGISMEKKCGCYTL